MQQPACSALGRRSLSDQFCRKLVVEVAAPHGARTVADSPDRLWRIAGPAIPRPVAQMGSSAGVTAKLPRITGAAPTGGVGGKGIIAGAGTSTSPE